MFGNIDNNILSSKSADVSANPPPRFYQRFNSAGEAINVEWPRITTEESEALFEPRCDGLHILIINAPVREWSYPNIMPIGQGYVASVAVMDGHQVDVLDLNAARKQPWKESNDMLSVWIKQNIMKKLEQKKPDVIGIGGIITQYRRIKEITSICKECYPDVPIVLGGGIASCMPEFMVKRLPIDVAVQEEGERTFSELLYRFEQGISLEGLEGIAYLVEIRRNERVVRNNGLRPSIKRLNTGLDALPWPLRSRWPIDEIYKQNPVGHLNWEDKWKEGRSSVPNQYSVSMLASRGCPYAAKACDYCYASYLGKQYRLRSPTDVVNEMEYLKTRYDVTYIHFLDDLLMTDFRWVLKFCDELEQRQKHTGFGVMWGGACRTNIIADDVLRAKREGRPHMLERAYQVGMRQVGYGIESASPSILSAIDKSGQTIEKMEIAVAETQRIMGYADCSFMIGSPGETEHTIQESVEFCKKVGLQPEVFFFTTAYPATPFWQLALDTGLITKAVTGKKGEVTEDIIEQYFLILGEQGDNVRTNFSDLSDDYLIKLSWSAITELGAQNTMRHPHTGDRSKTHQPVLRGASAADL